jgi:uncharacterized protein YbcI
MAETAQREIGQRVAEMHGHYYGRPPSSHLVYVLPEVVVVILEETFTPAELVLIERGEAGEVQEIRRRFQRVMEDEFRAVIEQATGTQVRAFISDVHLEAHVSVEIFLIGDRKENMAAFEVEMDRDETSERRRNRASREREAGGP